MQHHHWCNLGPIDVETPKPRSETALLQCMPNSGFRRHYLLFGYNSAQFDRVHHSPDGPSLTYSINHNYRKLDSPVQTAAGSIYFPFYFIEHCGSVRPCLLRGTMTRCCPNTMDRPCRIFGIHATIVHASDKIF
jgi:hypothetical protein